MEQRGSKAEKVVKSTVRGVLLFVCACPLIYPGDWVVWSLRGKPMGQVQVSRMAAAPLKNGKDDYYLDGLENDDCSASIFGWAGAGACWKLREHPEVVTQY